MTTQTSASVPGHSIVERLLGGLGLRPRKVVVKASGRDLWVVKRGNQKRVAGDVVEPAPGWHPDATIGVSLGKEFDETPQVSIVVELNRCRACTCELNVGHGPSHSSVDVVSPKVGAAAVHEPAAAPVSNVDAAGLSGPAAPTGDDR